MKLLTPACMPLTRSVSLSIRHIMGTSEQKETCIVSHVTNILAIKSIGNLDIGANL